VFVVGQGRSRLNRIDSNDRSAKALFVGTHFGREICQRRFVTQLAPQLLAGGFELPSLAANPSRPGILAQSVNHGSPDATFSERLELDAAPLVEPVRCVDEPNHTILDKISNIDRVGHRGRNTSGELFYKGNAGNNARILRTNLGAHACDLRRHVRQPRYQRDESTRIAVQRRDGIRSK